MQKLVSLQIAINEVKKAKKNGKKVGLITGCFDILHSGHIELFQFAKTSGCDFLMIGLENDQNIRLSKGKKQPYLNFKKRSEFLSEITSIDLIFPIKEVVRFGSEDAKKIYRNLYAKINPDYLVTNKNADRFWKRKEKIAKELGFKILLGKTDRLASSTNIGKARN